MKNKFKIAVIGLIAAIILPSCNSSLTITKRKANKGYYIDYSRIKKSTKASDFEAVAKVEKPIVLQTKKIEAIEVVASSKKIENFNNNEIATTKSTSVKLENDLKSKNTKLNKPNSQLQVTVPFSSKSTLIHVVKENKAISIVKAKMSPQPVEGALSLLWIVILVLLILWALGLLAGGWGLGGLINILLVIALILLILWLLRII
jgi:hypothetical protein